MSKFKEFFPTSWSVDNKTVIYLVTIAISLFGLFSYQSMPKDNFPEVIIPTINIMTIYPGTSPADMENLVTNTIEKKLKSLSGVKKVNSSSLQDISIITVEFNTDVKVDLAKQKVKDAVDKAKSDLPNDLPADPSVMEVDFSEFPIMSINLYGDESLDKLKQLADKIQDEIEGLKEITRCDVVGALTREIQVNVDLFKMSIAKVSFGDIERAIAMENMNISGGQLNVDNKLRSIRIKGEFKSMADIEQLVVKNVYGAPIRLQEIAEIKDGYKEQESYARYNSKNVITLNVIKRSGENLINASDKIQDILQKHKTKLPKTINVEVSGDQSENTRTTIHDLNNSIIIGFILVLIVLMFFMGAANAFFVALSVPLSVFLTFMVMPWLGFGLNMIVMFGLLFALGIIVDDAIVVIENTYRYFDNGKMSVIKAAKLAAGEIFVPVLAGTLTTLAPFLPLAFWQGIVGKFMFYLPITLILTLIASLIVAFIINPVFAVSFMKPVTKDNRTLLQKIIKPSLIMGFVAILCYASKFWFGGNFLLFGILLLICYHLFLKNLIHKFEFEIIPAFVNRYGKLLTFCLRGKRPLMMIGFTFITLVLSIIIMKISSPSVVFFPKGDPNFVYVYLQLPIGTHQSYTDSMTNIVAEKVKQVVNNSPIVESITSNVAVGASDPSEGDRTVASHKSRISVVFKKFADRKGESSSEILNKIRDQVKDLPGIKVSVDQERNGPPVGAPISIELAGDNMEELIVTSEKFKRYIDSLNIGGIENLKSDFVNNAPELIVEVDRVKAATNGISTAQVGMEIRTAVFGKEATKIKTLDDDIPVQVRFRKEQRHNLNELLNTIITFRDMTNGMVKQIPLSAVAQVKYSSAYGSIKHKNLKRVITLYSNVLGGYNANEINQSIREAAANYAFPSGVSLDMSGEQAEQAETQAFLGRSLLISLCLIFIILVTQFNSFSKPLIILSEIVLSIIGVMLGFGLTGMEMPIIMLGIGIVGLAGIVVKNGILIVEFADLMMQEGKDVYTAVIEAGKTRLKPVLLTAGATSLGLVPMAVGMNIDFYELFASFSPNIYLGGDSVVFWGPLSWTIIFGLVYATFLTLVLVPGLYVINEKIREKWRT